VLPAPLNAPVVRTPSLQELHPAEAGGHGQASAGVEGSGSGSGNVVATQAEMEEGQSALASSIVAAQARLSPVPLAEGLQALLCKCVEFMQEQSNIGSEALVSACPAVLFLMHACSPLPVACTSLRTYCEPVEFIWWCR